MTPLKKHSVPLVLFISLFLSFAYFNHRLAGWNVNSRLALTYAIVEQGVLEIDDYHDNPAMPYLQTNDKAFFRNRFYCDKSPALSFVAVPVYGAFWQAKIRFGFLGRLDQAKWVFWTRYAMRLAAVSFPAALLGVLLFALAERFGLGERAAFLLSVGLLWGTMLSAYATLFYPYLPAALCSVGSYCLLLAARTSDAPPRVGRFFLAGLLLGLGWFFEMITGLLGLGLGAYAAWTARHRLRTLPAFIFGGLLPVFVFYAYAWSIFGEFAIPYKYEFDPFFREEMSKGFSGIHFPRLGPFYYITIHPFRGLFFYSPFLLLAGAGFWAGFRRRDRFFPDLLLSLYAIGAYFALGSGYYMWWGGWAAGARHLCPALPFFLAPLAIFLARDSARWKRMLFATLLGVSVVLNFAIVAQDPQVRMNYPQEILLEARVSDNLKSPVLRGTYPRLWRGEVAANLGSEWAGLSGGWSLAPLGALALLTGGWLWGRGRREKDATSSETALSE